LHNPGVKAYFEIENQSMIKNMLKIPSSFKDLYAELVSNRKDRDNVKTSDLITSITFNPSLVEEAKGEILDSSKEYLESKKVKKLFKEMEEELEQFGEE